MVKIAIITDVHLSEKAPRYRKDDYLQTALNKLKYIADNNDYCILLGDLFNSASNSTYFFNTVFKFFKQYEGKFITILGNHDIVSRNHCDLQRTTIGSLYFTNVLDIKTESFKIDDNIFGVSLVDKSNLNEIPENVDVLLGHNYYGNNLCLEESLTREDLRRLKPVLCVLGHDHSPYEEDFIEETILLRIGSLTRIDTQKYNELRKIVYIQYDTESREYEIKKVPHLTTGEVYIENAFAKIIHRHDTSLLKVANVLERLSKNSSSELSLHKTLVKIGTSKRHIDKIKYKYETEGVNFN